MGVKLHLTQEDLPKEFSQLALKATSDGISDSVYLLGREYVLKVYENISYEKSILNLLRSLKVPKVIKSLKIKGKDALIMTQILGKSSTKYPLEIAEFLKMMHQKTKAKSSKNPMLFTMDRLFVMIKESGYKPFFKEFDSLKLELKNDGIIHGDLFPDNAKFIGKTLSGVYDFSEACEGDFLFDLAVVAMSFKADKEELLKVYGAKIDKKEFDEYIKFAKLYYGVSRYLHGKKDFREFFDAGEI